MKKIILFTTVLLAYFQIFAQFPTTFDLRDSGFVSSVKSQQGGTCWTHGTMAAIESNLLVNENWSANSETGEPNLAEYHLDWWNGFNEYYNGDLDNPFNNGEGLEVHMGGDYLVASAYLSRFTGAVRDIDGQSYDNPPSESSSDWHYYYPREIWWFTIDDTLGGIDSIKKMIMTYGAVATCMCYDNAFIDGDYNHYQPPSSNYLPNHSIAIVGWDDNRTTQAPEPGAWLCKNSWGTDWGYDGYFWISYYDKWACREPFMGAVSFINTEPLQYDLVYYHDYHGWRDTKTDITEAFNKFHSREDIWLKAVSFFTAEDSVQYKIKIYGKFSEGKLNYLLSEKQGVKLHRGFHTVDLDLPVRLHNGQDFFIYLYLSKGGHPYDRTSTINVLMGDTTIKKGLKEPVLVTSSANPEESYYFEDGEWKDFYYYNDPSGYQNSGNFCIKGLAKSYQPQNLGAVIHIYNENEPVEGATVIFDGDTVITGIDGTAIFKGYEPYTQNLELEFYFDQYSYTDTFSIADTVLILDFYYPPASVSSNEIRIYPNPANNYLTINNLQAEQIKIYDVLGRKIFEQKIKANSININTSAWNEGIYILKTNKGVIKKFVVRH